MILRLCSLLGSAGIAACEGAILGCPTPLQTGANSLVFVTLDGHCVGVLTQVLGVVQFDSRGALDGTNTGAHLCFLTIFAVCHKRHGGPCNILARQVVLLTVSTAYRCDYTHTRAADRMVAQQSCTQSPCKFQSLVRESGDGGHALPDQCAVGRANVHKRPHSSLGRHTVNIASDNHHVAIVEVDRVHGGMPPGRIIDTAMILGWIRTTLPSLAPMVAPLQDRLTVSPTYASLPVSLARRFDASTIESLAACLAVRPALATSHLHCPLDALPAAQGIIWPDQFGAMSAPLTTFVGAGE